MLLDPALHVEMGIGQGSGVAQQTLGLGELAIGRFVVAEVVIELRLAHPCARRRTLLAGPPDRRDGRLVLPVVPIELRLEVADSIRIGAGLPRALHVGTGGGEAMKTLLLFGAGEKTVRVVGLHRETFAEDVDAELDLVEVATVSTAEMMHAGEAQQRRGVVRAVLREAFELGDDAVDVREVDGGVGRHRRGRRRLRGRLLPIPPPERDRPRSRGERTRSDRAAATGSRPDCLVSVDLSSPTHAPSAAQKCGGSRTSAENVIDVTLASRVHPSKTIR